MTNPDDSPRRLLMLGAALPVDPARLAASLHQPGRDSLVQHAQEQNADGFVLHAAASELDAWLDALEALQPSLPGVCVVTDAPADLPQQQRGWNAGVQVWLTAAPDAATLAHHLRWAGWQHARHSALRATLDDRKWTDRAKGLLMAARDLDEASAFRLLREAAMHAHLRLGEVARSVVHAAQLAEAVNLAGQQRMLSQRLVKLMAQRAAGLEAKRAKVLQDESSERVRANLARLPAILPPGLSIAALDEAWQALAVLLVGKPTAEALLAADAAAQALLEHSEACAGAIAQAGGGRPLHVVNLCGRQRMLSQRLAKEALLADLLPGRDAAVLADCLDEFAAGLAALEASPLSSEAIRALLAEVSAEWLRLRRCLQGPQGREAAAGLARGSEVLLGQLERLTGLYQQSLQIILG